MTAGSCWKNWRVELCDLATGLVSQTVNPISANWQVKKNDAGTGTLVLPIDTPLAEVWPMRRSVYVSRVAGDGATLYDPACEFAGYIETFDFTNGTLMIGLQELTAYLKRRVLTVDYTVASRDQNLIAADLVGMAAPNSVPLTASGVIGTKQRQRTYAQADHSDLFTLVTQLCGVQDGPSWTLVHTRDNLTGAWATEMVFSDTIGADRPATLVSDRDVFQQALQVTGVNIATNVIALGAQQPGDGSVLTATAADATVHPQWDAVPSLSTVTEQATLQEAANGDLADWREPVASPGFSMAGLTPSPLQARIGDTLHVHLAFGPYVWAGEVEVETISWTLSNGASEQRTFEVTALTDVEDAIVPNAMYCGVCHAQP